MLFFYVVQKIYSYFVKILKVFCELMNLRSIIVNIIYKILLYYLKMCSCIKVICIYVYFIGFFLKNS